jgi:hypothetical protein
MNLWQCQPTNGLAFIWKYLSTKPPLHGLGLRMSIAIQGYISFGDEGDLEPRWDPDNVQRNDDVTRGEMAVRVLCAQPNNQNAGELVFKRDGGHGSVALLNLRSAI